jgi:hypothetical protein
MQHEHTIFRSIAEHKAYNIQIKSRAAEHEAYYIQSKSRAQKQSTKSRDREEAGDIPGGGVDTRWVSSCGRADGRWRRRLEADEQVQTSKTQGG